MKLSSSLTKSTRVSVLTVLVVVQPSMSDGLGLGCRVSWIPVRKGPTYSSNPKPPTHKTLKTLNPKPKNQCIKHILQMPMERRGDATLAASAAG